MERTTDNLEQLSPQDTGKAMRAALREAFPGVKFSVRMSRGTAWGSFSVNWTDGPTSAKVEEITRQFVGKTFDGMDDSTHYIRAEITWKGKRYISGAGYVLAQQRISEERRAAVVEVLRRAFPDASEGALLGAWHQAAHSIVDGKISAEALFACQRHHIGLGQARIIADHLSLTDPVTTPEQAAPSLGFVPVETDDPHVERMRAAGWLR